jgi:hypothetical protein
VAREARKACRGSTRKVVRLTYVSKSAPSRRRMPKPPPLAVVVYLFYWLGWVKCGVRNNRLTKKLSLSKTEAVIRSVVRRRNVTSGSYLQATWWLFPRPKAGHNSIPVHIRILLIVRMGFDRLSPRPRRSESTLNDLQAPSGSR